MLGKKFSLLIVFIVLVLMTSALVSAQECRDNEDNDGDGDIDLGGCDCDGDGTLDSYIGWGDPGAHIIGLCTQGDFYTDEEVENFNNLFVNLPDYANECNQKGTLVRPDTGCSDARDDSEGVDVEDATLTFTHEDGVIVPSSAQVARSRAGFVTVYESNDNIFYAAYDTKGTLKDSGEVTVCRFGEQSNPDVAMNNEGVFTVTWETEVADARQSSNADCKDIYPRYEFVDEGAGRSDPDRDSAVVNHRDIAARILSFDGETVTAVESTTRPHVNGEFRVNNHNIGVSGKAAVSNPVETNWWAGLGREGSPSVAMHEDKIVIGWDSEFKSDLNYGVYAKMYDTLGNVIDRAGDGNYNCDASVNNNVDECNGAAGNEIPLFTGENHNKRNVELAAGFLNGEQVFVASWNREDLEVEPDEKPWTSKVRVFSFENGEPLTNVVTAGVENSRKEFPKVALTQDDGVIVGWNSQEKRAIVTSEYSFTGSALSARSDGDVLFNENDVNGNCLYLIDIASSTPGRAGGSSGNIAVFGVSSYSSQECSDTFGSSGANQPYSTAYIYDLDSDTALAAPSFRYTAGSSGAIGSSLIYPAVAVQSFEGILHTYRADEDSIEVSNYNFDGGLEPFEAPSVESTYRPPTPMCDLFGCDCDGNGKVDTHINDNSALAQTLCERPEYEPGVGKVRLDPTAGGPGVDAECVDAGVWYGPLEADQCPEEAESAEDLVPRCQDGKDNDGDGGIDYIGACLTDQGPLSCSAFGRNTRLGCVISCSTNLQYTGKQFVAGDPDCTSGEQDRERPAVGQQAPSLEKKTFWDFITNFHVWTE